MPAPRIRTPRRAPTRWFYGWAIVAVAFAVNFGSVVCFNPILAVFAGPLRDEFGWGRGQVSLAITIGSIAAGLTAPLVGFLADRRGGRWVIAPAALLMAASLASLHRLSHLWQLYVFYSLGRALAVGALQVAAAVAVSNWFIRRRGFTLAIANAGSRVGMATLPVLTSVVIAATGSWRDGWLFLATVIALLGVVPPALLLHRRPEDRGLRPDGDGPHPRAHPDERTPADPAWSLREALGTRAYWLVGGAIAVVLFGSGSINFHTIPHLEDRGLSRTTAALVVTLYSTMAAVGGIAGGIVATRLRARWTLVASLAGMAVGVLLLLAAENVAVAMLFALSFGIAFGSFVTLSQVIYADYFGRRSMGVIYGSIQPVQLTFNALGPYVAGVWFDHAASYRAPFMLFAVLFLLAAGGLALSPAPRQRAA